MNFGAAAARSSTVHVVDSNTTSEFAQTQAASSIDPDSANVEHAPPSSEPSSLCLPPSGMLSSTCNTFSGVEVVSNYQHQQNMCVQQMQYMPPMHMPISAVMPSISTSPTSSVAMPLPAQQANPIFGVGMMVGGGAYSMPQNGPPSASLKLAVSFAAYISYVLSVAFVAFKSLSYMCRLF